MTKRTMRTTLIAVAATAALNLTSIHPAAAVDLPVTAGAVDTTTNGNCSLIEAVQAANSGLAVDDCPAAGDTIVLPAGSEFVLTTPADAIGGGTGLPAITASIVIQGNGATIRRDTDGPRFRLLWIESDIEVGIYDLTLQNGHAVDAAGIDGSGGGIYNTGDLYLENVSLFANDAASPGQGDANPANGGGLLNVGTAALQGCRVAFNRAADGSAVWSNDQVSLTDTWVFDNDGRYAILVTGSGGLLISQGSTISRNEDAGVKVTGGASARLSNSTLSGNGPIEGAGTLIGAGIMAEATVSLEHVTVTENVGSDGGGVWASAFLGQLTLANTLIAGNVAANGSDCLGPVVSQGGNLLRDGAGCTGITDGVGGDQVGADPLLGALADNGGPTQTHLLSAGSPAIDAALGGACTAADQRGIVRPQGPGCDVGAVEVEAGPPGPGAPQDVPTLGGFGLLVLVSTLGALALRALRPV